MVISLNNILTIIFGILTIVFSAFIALLIHSQSELRKDIRDGRNRLNELENKFVKLETEFENLRFLIDWIKENGTKKANELFDALAKGNGKDHGGVK